MTGEELASRLGEAADVVMIVPQDYEGEEAENVIMLHNPISQDALVQSLKRWRTAVCACSSSAHELKSCRARWKSAS